MQGSLQLRSGQALRLRNCFAPRGSSFAQDDRDSRRLAGGLLKPGFGWGCSCEKQVPHRACGPVRNDKVLGSYLGG